MTTLTSSYLSFDNVYIIDDDSESRQASQYVVEDLDWQPILVEGPLRKLSELVTNMSISSKEAVLCDYHLKKKNYATFNGAEVVATLYKQNIPAVLHTSLTGTLDEIRPFRRFIPALLDPGELEPDTLLEGFYRCIKEFQGEYITSRRPWRALVRVDMLDKEDRVLHIVIPAWEPRKIIRLHFDDVDESVVERVRNYQQEHFHAQINIGAEADDELYFDKWELE